uniref:Lipocalin/cytosolic fatty-acid binding domain-containing protein n=1 Tax=Timema cristinae TaxID=61476 RepID=A0A7R9D4M3_TIMCR|nr:unnamed protein product [Timema cristinae]
MVLLLLGVLLITSQVFATCPEKVAKSNIDSTRVGGVWHNYKVSSNALPVKCFHVVVTPGEDGSLGLSQAFYNTTSNSYIQWSNTLTRKSPTSSDAKYADGSRNFYILDTDYSNFAVWWYCGPKYSNKDETIEVTWLASRTKSLSTSVEVEANGALPSGEYVLSDQSGCPEHDH